MLLFLSVLLLSLMILLRRNTDHGFQRLDHLVIRHFFRSAHDPSEFHPTGSLHNYIISWRISSFPGERNKIFPATRISLRLLSPCSSSPLSSIKAIPSSVQSLHLLSVLLSLFPVHPGYFRFLIRTLAGALFDITHLIGKYYPITFFVAL